MAKADKPDARKKPAPKKAGKPAAPAAKKATAAPPAGKKTVAKKPAGKEAAAAKKVSRKPAAAAPHAQQETAATREPELRSASGPLSDLLAFPDWGLFMPVVFLTGGRVATHTTEDLATARETLCAGHDVAVPFITGDRSARIASWREKLAWDPPDITPYAQADGKVVFDLATFRGRRGGPGCG